VNVNRDITGVSPRRIVFKDGYSTACRQRRGRGLRRTPESESGTG